MKKVCFVFHNADKTNGATKSFLELIYTWISDNLFDVTCILPNAGSAYDELKNHGVSCIIIPNNPNRYYSTENKAIAFIKNVVRRFRLIHERFITVPKSIKRYSLNDYNLVYSNTSSIFFGYWLSRKINVPHFWHLREMGEEDQNAIQLFGAHYLYRCMNHSKLLIAISKVVYEKYHNKISKDNLIYAYNDISIQNSCPTIHSFSLPYKVMLVGAIIEGKGHEQVIRAISLLKKRHYNIQLYVYGKTIGEYYKKMKLLSRQLDCEEIIHFVGHSNDMISAKSDMNIEVVASRCEAFGRITVEAMLCKLPLIGANTGCTKELIADNINGLLYEWGSVDDLATKIEYSYNNYDKMISLAENAYSFSLQFTQGATAKLLEKKIIDCIE